MKRRPRARSGVHRQSVNRWAQQLANEGRGSLKHAGRRPRLSEAERQKIERAVKRGPEALGYSTGLWTAWRVADLIKRERDVEYHPAMGLQAIPDDEQGTTDMPQEMGEGLHDLRAADGRRKSRKQKLHRGTPATAEYYCSTGRCQTSVRATSRSSATRRALARMHRRPALVRAFWQQAELLRPSLYYAETR